LINFVHLIAGLARSNLGWRSIKLSLSHPRKGDAQMLALIERLKARVSFIRSAWHALDQLAVMKV
jgi:hypothetical protein